MTLRLANVSKSYLTTSGPVKVVDNFSIQVATGERVAIVGPSGSGKSTMLAIAGLLHPADAGEVEIQGKLVSSSNDEDRAIIRRERIGYVFQSFSLLGHLDARRNVAEAFAFSDVPMKDRLELAEGALRQVGLSHRLGHRPKELSGGEQQRVAIARAIVKEPALLLADEPTGNLDPSTSEQIVDLLMHSIGDSSLVMVTHDTEVAAEADRIITFADHNESNQ